MQHFLAAPGRLRVTVLAVGQEGAGRVVRRRRGRRRVRRVLRRCGSTPLQDVPAETARSRVVRACEHGYAGERLRSRALRRAASPRGMPFTGCNCVLQQLNMGLCEVEGVGRAAGAGAVARAVLWTACGPQLLWCCRAGRTRMSVCVWRTGGAGAGTEQGFAARMAAWLRGRSGAPDRIELRDIDAALLDEAAAATQGFSGRELAKLVASMQVCCHNQGLSSVFNYRLEAFRGWSNADMKVSSNAALGLLGVAFRVLHDAETLKSSFRVSSEVPNRPCMKKRLWAKPSTCWV